MTRATLTTITASECRPPCGRALQPPLPPRWFPPPQPPRTPAQTSSLPRRVRIAHRRMRSRSRLLTPGRTPRRLLAPNRRRPQSVIRTWPLRLPSSPKARTERRRRCPRGSARLDRQRRSSRLDRCAAFPSRSRTANLMPRPQNSPHWLERWRADRASGCCPVLASLMPPQPPPQRSHGPPRLRRRPSRVRPRMTPCSTRPSVRAPCLVRSHHPLRHRHFQRQRPPLFLLLRPVFRRQPRRVCLQPRESVGA